MNCEQTCTAASCDAELRLKYENQNSEIDIYPTVSSVKHRTPERIMLFHKIIKQTYDLVFKVKWVQEN